MTALARRKDRDRLRALGVHTVIDYADPVAVSGIELVDALIDLVGFDLGGLLIDKVRPGWLSCVRDSMFHSCLGTAGGLTWG